MHESEPSRLDALVVGAGIAGLYQLYRLREQGLNVRVVEAAPDVGGTWFFNQYPGARCDVESMNYSYSFSLKLEQEWSWTQKYATQPEILRYVNHVADRFDLRKDIRFSTRVLSAVYDEASGRWDVTTDGGDVINAQFVIMATGCLSASKAPEIPGVDLFDGPTYHTAHWPHEKVDFTGLRVGVIGTGSSGIQVIPEIAKQASDLTVFQRTPNFSTGARHRPLSEEEVRDRKAGYRPWRQAQKESFFGIPEPIPTQSALEVSEAERTARYQSGWDSGTLNGLLASYNDIVTDRAANDTAAEFVRSRIREKVTDPAVAETLSPRSFPYGTKRPCLDDGYYETFNKPNVHLVDLKKTPLVEITGSGARTDEKHYLFDAIVFATGFDALTGALTAIDIRGSRGLSFKEKWSEGPRNYLGLMVAGFPNLFTITGPLSPSVLSNMVVSIEQHVEWISDCLSVLRTKGHDTIEATVEAEDQWVEHVAEIGSHTLVPTANSFYMGSNVPGKPRVLMAYFAGVAAYRAECEAVVARDYEGFVRSNAASNAAAAPAGTERALTAGRA